MSKFVVVTLGVVLAIVVLLSFSEGCYLPPPVDSDYPAHGQPETFPDDSPEAAKSPCGRSCDAFKRLGCPEGAPSQSGVSCYRVCVHGATLRRVPATCWASAPTVTSLRACGGVRCMLDAGP